MPGGLTLYVSLMMKIEDDEDDEGRLDRLSLPSPAFEKPFKYDDECYGDLEVRGK